MPMLTEVQRLAEEAGFTADGPCPPNVRDRNWVILNRHLAGETYTAIGKDIGVTRTTVRVTAAKVLKIALRRQARPNRAPAPPLSDRAYMCLQKIGVATVSQASALTDRELLSVRNLGRKTLREIRGFAPCDPNSTEDVSAIRARLSPR